MIKKMAPSANPIIVKELRSKMRGSRPFVTLTVMLILLAGITYGIYRLSISVMGNYSGTPVSPQIGQALFTLLSFLLLLIILIITPAETSSAISGEREQLTYEMLLSTPMHPAKILSGKLFSALSYIFLLIFSAIPIFSMIFMFGGVSLRDMLKTLIVLIVVAVSLGVFGIFMSSLFQRSSRATVISYIVITLTILGTLIVYVASGIMTNGNPPRWILTLNPFSTLASAMTNPANPYNSILGFIPFLGGDLSTLRGDIIGISYIPRPLYHYSLPIYGFLSIVLYFISSRLVLPTKKWRLPRKEILIFLTAILFLLAVTLAGYYATTDSYEQAVFDPANQGMFAEPMIERPMMGVGVAVEVQPAILEEFSGESGTVSIESQVSIYSLAITDAVEAFGADRDLPVERLFLVSTILETDGDSSYSFNLPQPLQEAITKEISDLSPSIAWVATNEEVINNPDIGLQPGDYVLNVGDTLQTNDEQVSLYVTINIGGTVERQTVYTLAYSDDGAWKIESEEIVFDAQEGN